MKYTTLNSIGELELSAFSIMTLPSVNIRTIVFIVAPSPAGILTACLGNTPPGIVKIVVHADILDVGVKRTFIEAIQVVNTIDVKVDSNVP